LDITYDQYAPVGEGIALLTLLGGAYLLGKRRRKE
jgi:LPXTG-motif cell wall-anchored protein